MNHLHRDLAPLSDEAWKAVDDEVAAVIKAQLAGRRLVDIDGPHGYQLSSLESGRVERPTDGPVRGAQAAVRQSRPLVELRTPFTLSRRELADVDRGLPDPDLDPAREAGRAAALAEDTALFKGYEPAGMEGLARASTHEPLEISNDYNQYPTLVARAVAKLEAAGIDGPYGVALGPRCYTGVVETTEHGGYPVFDHLHRLVLGGPVVRAEAVDGAVVLSLRGGDFRFVIGQDFAVGYDRHDAETVDLYILETLRVHVLEPAAAIALRYPDAR